MGEEARQRIDGESIVALAEANRRKELEVCGCSDGPHLTQPNVVAILISFADRINALEELAAALGSPQELTEAFGELGKAIKGKAS